MLAAVGSGLRPARRAARAFATLAQTRDASYSRVEDGDIAHFTNILGAAGVLKDAHDIEPFNRDWMGKWSGSCPVVLLPRTTAEVSAILRHCHARRLAVVPQGGNTGLVGGSVPLFDEVVLSTSRMNAIERLDPLSGVLVCQAGCVLQTLDEAAQEAGWVMPLDLGAKGSCQIGGNVSTNAGGLRLLRYGSLHGRVLGLEAVLADGTVLDALTALKKDNTGYDLKQLFIGSEGTLGIITRAAIECAPKPAGVEVAYAACPSWPFAEALLARARAELGETLSAFEFLDRESLQIVLGHLPGARDPLPDAEEPLYLVIEAAGSRPESVAEGLAEFLGRALEDGLVSDALVAQDLSQAAMIWKVREGITEALRHRGAFYKYDLSFGVSDMYDCVEGLRARLADAFPALSQPRSSGNGDGCTPLMVLGYGHLGDGNVHLNVSAPAYDPRLLDAIEPWVYEFTASRRGSISAEHGLGAMKAAAAGYSNSPQAIQLMRELKRTLDPRGILNPYKVLPPPEARQGAAHDADVSER